jgi:hypothetical protein
LVLSYRIDAGTPPKNVNAATWPAQNASVVSAGCLHEAGIAVRQVHRGEMDLPFHPADHRQHLAKVRLRVPGIMPQRHEHLSLPLTLRQHVVFDDRQAAGVAMLVAQTLEDPLGCVPRLRRSPSILLQDPLDDARERIQLRTRRRPAPPVARRHRERQHLRHRPRVDPETSRRRSPADPLNLNRVPDRPYSSTSFIPQPFAFTAKSFPPPEFYAGATGQPGYFSEGFCLRRAQRSRAQQWCDAVADLLALQAEYAAWRTALPESLQGSATAEALDAIVDLDLDALAAIVPPRGYGRD